MKWYNKVVLNEVQDTPKYQSTVTFGVIQICELCIQLCVKEGRNFITGNYLEQPAVH